MLPSTRSTNMSILALCLICGSNYQWLRRDRVLRSCSCNYLTVLKQTP